MKSKEQLIAELLTFLNRPGLTAEEIDVAFDLRGGVGEEIAAALLATRDRLIADTGQGFQGLGDLLAVFRIGPARVEGMLDAVRRGALLPPPPPLPRPGGPPLPLPPILRTLVPGREPPPSPETESCARKCSIRFEACLAPAPGSSQNQCECNLGLMQCLERCLGEL